jgi:hypothetical protein
MTTAENREYDWSESLAGPGIRKREVLYCTQKTNVFNAKAAKVREVNRGLTGLDDCDIFFCGLESAPLNRAEGTLSLPRRRASTNEQVPGSATVCLDRLPVLDSRLRGNDMPP